MDDTLDRFDSVAIDEIKTLDILDIQESCKKLVHLVEWMVKPSREYSLFLTHLEIAAMFAAKAVSRR